MLLEHSMNRMYMDDEHDDDDDDDDANRCATYFS